jgi:hypothetical protein
VILFIYFENEFGYLFIYASQETFSHLFYLFIYLFIVIFFIYLLIFNVVVDFLKFRFYLFCIRFYTFFQYL